jgi:hypothetical protein
MSWEEGAVRGKMGEDSWEEEAERWGKGGEMGVRGCKWEEG